MEKLREWLTSLLIMLVLLITSFVLDDRCNEEELQAQLLDELLSQSK